MPNHDGAPSRPRIALALSGGGFRASIFHLGVIQRIAELGWLERVDVISAVSGGSILAAYLALHWDRMLRAGGTVNAFQDVIARPFVEILTSENFILRWAARLWESPFRKVRDGTFTRTKLAGKLYSEMFFDGQTCADLPQRPYLILNAASLLSIRAWRFTRGGLGDSRIGHAAWGDKPFLLGEAVAASAAFPPLFPPPRIRSSDYDFGRPIYGEKPLPLRKYIPLSDGGVYDNLGLEAVQKPTAMPGLAEPLPAAEFLIVSDAGYPAQFRFRSSGIPVLSEALLLYRVDDIAREQVCAQRRRELIAKFRDSSSLLKGVLIPLSSSLEKLGPASHQAYSTHVPPGHQVPEALLALISSIRTHLDRFTALECEALMYHAYSITDAVLWPIGRRALMHIEHLKYRRRPGRSRLIRRPSARGLADLRGLALGLSCGEAANALGAVLLSPFLHPGKHLPLGLEPLVRVVLQHPPREMSGDRLDDVLRFARLEQIGHDGVSQIVEAEAGQAGRIA
jgi:NTE family protein